MELSRFQDYFKKVQTFITMVNSVSFVSTGTFNHVFPSLPMHTLLSSNFDEGNLEDKSVPHYL